MYNEIELLNFFKNFFEILKYNIKSTISLYIHFFILQGRFSKSIECIISFYNSSCIKSGLKQYNTKKRE
jgi:hypothetical protein